MEKGRNESRREDFKKKSSSIDKRVLRAHRRSLEWKQLREDAVSRKRNIQESSMTPVKEEANNDENKDTKKDARREALKKWKEEKELKRKLEAKQNAKKMFKVTHLEHSLPRKPIAQLPKVQAPLKNTSASSKTTVNSRRVTRSSSRVQSDSARSTTSQITTSTTKAKESVVQQPTTADPTTRGRAPKVPNKKEEPAAPVRLTRSRATATTTKRPPAKSTETRAGRSRARNPEVKLQEPSKAMNPAEPHKSCVNNRRGDFSFAPDDHKFMAPSNLQSFVFKPLSPTSAANFLFPGREDNTWLSPVPKTRTRRCSTPKVVRRSSRKSSTMTRPLSPAEGNDPETENINGKEENPFEHRTQAIDTDVKEPATDLPVADVVPATDLPVADVVPATDLPVADVVPATDLPVADVVPDTDLPVADVVPATDLPVADVAPATDLPVADVVPATDLPVADVVPGTDLPVAGVVPATDLPVADVVPDTDLPVADVVPATDLPVADVVPATDLPVADVVPATDLPVADVVPATDLPVADVVPATDLPVADVVPDTDLPVADVVPATDLPVADVVPATDLPVADVVPATDLPVAGVVPDAKATVDTIPEIERSTESEGTIADDTAPALPKPATPYVPRASRRSAAGSGSGPVQEDTTAGSGKGSSVGDTPGGSGKGSSVGDTPGGSGKGSSVGDIPADSGNTVGVFKTPRSILRPSARKASRSMSVAFTAAGSAGRLSKKDARCSLLLQSLSPEEGVEFLKHSPMVEMRRKTPKRRKTSDYGPISPMPQFDDVDELLNSTGGSSSDGGCCVFSADGPRQAGDSHSSTLSSISEEAPLLAEDQSQPISDGSVSSEPNEERESDRGDRPSNSKGHLQDTPTERPPLDPEAQLSSGSQSAKETGAGSGVTAVPEGSASAGSSSQEGPSTGAEESPHDIPYFRRRVVEVTARLDVLSEHWSPTAEGESSGNLTEEVLGQVRTTVGQAQLLKAPKGRFQQFATLVDNCEFGRGEKETTCEDLQGFWDMVYLQVEDVYHKFQVLDKLKANNWLLEKSSVPKKRLLKKKPAAVKATAKPVAKPAAKSKFAGFRARMMAQTVAPGGALNQCSMRQGAPSSPALVHRHAPVAVTPGILVSSASDVEPHASMETVESLPATLTDAAIVTETKTFDAGFFRVSSPVRAVEYHCEAGTPSKSRLSGSPALASPALASPALASPALVSPRLTSGQPLVKSVLQRAARKSMGVDLGGQPGQHLGCSPRLRVPSGLLACPAPQEVLPVYPALTPGTPATPRSESVAARTRRRTGSLSAPLSHALQRCLTPARRETPAVIAKASQPSLFTPEQLDASPTLRGSSLRRSRRKSVKTCPVESADVTEKSCDVDSRVGADAFSKLLSATTTTGGATPERVELKENLFTPTPSSQRRKRANPFTPLSTCSPSKNACLDTDSVGGLKLDDSLLLTPPKHMKTSVDVPLDDLICFSPA